MAGGPLHEVREEDVLVFVAVGGELVVVVPLDAPLRAHANRVVGRERPGERRVEPVVVEVVVARQVVVLVKRRIARIQLEFLAVVPVLLAAPPVVVGEGELRPGAQIEVGVGPEGVGPLVLHAVLARIVVFRVGGAVGDEEAASIAHFVTQGDRGGDPQLGVVLLLDALLDAADQDDVVVGDRVPVVGLLDADREAEPERGDFIPFAAERDGRQRDANGDRRNHGCLLDE